MDGYWVTPTVRSTMENCLSLLSIILTFAHGGVGVGVGASQMCVLEGQSITLSWPSDSPDDCEYIHRDLDNQQQFVIAREEGAPENQYFDGDDSVLNQTTFSDRWGWITDPVKPCMEGITKTVHANDTGLYNMVHDAGTGTGQGRPTPTTSLEVIHGADLIIQVTIAETGRNVTLDDPRNFNLTLEPYVTDGECVTLEIQLSDSFRIRELGTRVRFNTTDFPCVNQSSCAIWVCCDVTVTIETGIKGAETVIIRQAVTIETSESSAPVGWIVAVVLLSLVIILTLVGGCVCVCTQKIVKVVSVTYI